jgi:hypothetical protein
MRMTMGDVKIRRTPAVESFPVATDPRPPHHLQDSANGRQQDTRRPRPRACVVSSSNQQVMMGLVKNPQRFNSRMAVDFHLFCHSLFSARLEIRLLNNHANMGCNLRPKTPPTDWTTSETNATRVSVPKSCCNWEKGIGLCVLSAAARMQLAVS